MRAKAAPVGRGPDARPEASFCAGETEAQPPEGFWQLALRGTPTSVMPVTVRVMQATLSPN